MRSSASDESPATTIATLFDTGPPLGIQLRLGLVQPGRLHVGRRAALAIAIGWVPLVGLTALRGDLLGSGPNVFVTDLATHARLLVAVPFFIIAESVRGPRLTMIARHFVDAGLVASAEHDRFAAAVRSTRRLRDSRIAELTVLVLAYVVVVLILSSAPAAIVPGWNRTGADATALSPAGRWHAFVSMPILLTLFLGWMWRLALWARFLRLMARLDLQLVASHPDGAGGLRFVGYSSRAAAPLAFALGAVVAGRLANLVLHTGASPFDSRYTVAGLVVFLVVLFNGPLVAFIGPMLTAWQQGAARYGALAAVEGRAFERKWLTEARRGDEEMLAATDFSATTDLYAVVANVYAMRPLPLDLQSIAALVTATLLPFVPVVLMAVPFDVIIGRLTSLLL